jgi:hypothetical protein
LVKYYTELYNEKSCKYGKITIEEMLEEGWYEEMYVEYVKIIIDKNEKLSSRIRCWFTNQERKTQDFAITIETEENKISSMNILRI